MVKLETVCLTGKTVNKRTDHISLMEDSNLVRIYASYQKETKKKKKKKKGNHFAIPHPPCSHWFSSHSGYFLPYTTLHAGYTEVVRHDFSFLLVISDRS